MNRTRSLVPDAGFGNQTDQLINRDSGTKNSQFFDNEKVVSALAASYSADTPYQKDQDELLRLQYDFDFVQNLVSSDYIKFLNKKGYF